MSLIKELEFWKQGIEDHSDDPLPNSHPLVRAIEKLRSAEELAEAGNVLANYLERLCSSNPPDRPSYEEVLIMLVQWDAARKAGGGE